MSEPIIIEIDMPADRERFTLPLGVKHRLDALLDRQDRDDPLTPDERNEAEGLVDLAELLTLLKLRAKRVAKNVSDSP